MATIQQSWRTLQEAFDMVGGGLYGDAWVGLQARHVQWQHLLPTVEDLEKAKEAGLKTPDLPGEEVTREMHREANAQERPSPERAKQMVDAGQGLSHWPDPDSQEYLEQYDARCRRLGAETKLREIMSNYDIESRLRDGLSGRPDFVLEQSHWEPHHKNFWINPSSGLCGFITGGPDSGHCRIDRLQFDNVVKALFGRGSPKKSVREESKAKKRNKYEAWFEIATRKKEENPELRGHPQELSRAVAHEYNQDKPSKQNERATTIRRRLYDHYPGWPD